MSTDSPVSIDELLAHRDWVRGLAGALVREPADADDLAQDVWQRAVTNPPAARGSVRSWLATVLRNRAIEVRRNDARRGARIDRAADLEDVPAGARGGDDSTSPAALAERAELERRVLGVLNSLDAPHRDVVLLRFWKGLDSDEIAALRGIAPATARTRLFRALAEIRARLDRELGGRDAWRAALLPIAALESNGSCGAAKATSGARSATRVAVAVACVAALVAVVWLLSDAAGSRTTATAPTPVTTSVAATAAPHAPRARAKPPTAVVETDAAAAPGPGPREPSAVSETHDATPEPVNIRVRVTDAAHRPVAGARVATAGTDVGKSGRVIAASGVTDANGEVALAWVGEPATARALAQADGAAGISAPFDTEPGTDVSVEVALGAARPIAGVVLRPDGTPAPLAYVMLCGSFNRSLEAIAATTASPDGRFDFGAVAVAVATSGFVEVAAAEFPHRWTSLRDVADVGAFVVRLDEPMVVVGRVVDEAGAPVADVPVYVEAADTQLTDRAGRFRTNPFRPAPVRAVILPDDHAARTVDATGAVSGTCDLGNIVVSSGLPMRGLVVDSGGRPVPRAFVAIEDVAASQIVRQGEADAEGRFAFEHLAAGAHVVRAQAPDGDSAFAGQEGTTSDVRGGDVSVRVVVSAGRSVVVSLVDAESGRPIDGATNVGASLLSAADPNVGSRSTFGSDNVRSFRMSIRTAGPADLTVTVPGYEPFGPERLDVPEHEDLRVTARLRPKK